MARNLVFRINNAELAAAPVKVDRKKLYGWTELKALDDEGRECRTVTMDETGTMILPKGGLGMGLLSPDREWVERSSLKAVKADGAEAETIPSSYNAPIELTETVDAAIFLDHNITAVYHLQDAPADFITAVGDKIYAFTYSFRDSYKGDPAFVLVSGSSLFMLVGIRAEYEMLTLAQAESLDETESEDDEEESDDFDFSM